MYDFAYHRPETVEEALAVLRGSADGRLLAGGHTLIPTLKQRLAQSTDLIDLAGIAELSGICTEGAALVIGAMTTHAEVAASTDVTENIPALAALVTGIGDPQVRNRGTIGGSIANNDPAADYPAALLALGATVKTDSRSLAAVDFFTGMFETALADDEMVTAVQFPVPEASGYAKFPNPASRYPVVGVFVARVAGAVRVAVTGAAACVFRIPEMEQALSRAFTPEAVDGITVPADALNSDLNASAEYRAHLVTVMAKRAVAGAR